jgi:hypothetical protein
MPRPDLEPRLRQALAERAARATTSADAWAAIQRRRRRRRRGGLLVALAALALAVVVAVPLVMVLRGGDRNMPPAPATRPPATTVPAPTTTTGSAPGSTRQATVRASAVADPGAALRAIGQRVPGSARGAVRYSDALGDNLVVLSVLAERKPSLQVIGERSDWITLYAHQYVTSGGRTRLVRTVTDGVQDCTVDHQAEFAPRTPEVSDVDGDGVGEVLFGYTVGCHGDISPVRAKLLLLEGGDKYIMRGESYSTPGTGRYALGRLPLGAPEPAWSAWPKRARTLAERHWDQVAVRE